MKDKVARRDIEELKLADGYLGKRFHKLDEIDIKDCPECKHRVMALRGAHAIREGSSYWTYQCLAHGCKFTCKNEFVCRVVE